jgi:hypothetical protein
MSASAASRPSRDVWNSIDILSFEKILSFELTLLTGFLYLYGLLRNVILFKFVKCLMKKFYLKWTDNNSSFNRCLLFSFFWDRLQQSSADERGTEMKQQRFWELKFIPYKNLFWRKFEKITKAIFYWFILYLTLFK